MQILKKQLRERLREKRRQLSPYLQDHAARRICCHLMQMAHFKQSQHIALYCPILGEVLTAFILARAKAWHKCCYFPALDGKKLQFIKMESDTIFVKNRFGILEPSLSHAKTFPPQALDLVILPLVAFDSQCHRLGMGGGYYDYTFAFRRKTLKPLLVGIAYDFQWVKEIPSSNLDVLLDYVVTEKHIYSQSN